MRIGQEKRRRGGGGAKSNNRKIARFGGASTFNCPSLNFLKTEKLYAPLSYRGEEKEGFFDLQDWAEITVMSLGAGRRRRGRDPAFHLIGQLDKGGPDEMNAEPVPDGGSGKEILEKLRKASLKVGL
jgi:hypothetical protein